MFVVDRVIFQIFNKVYRIGGLNGGSLRYYVGHIGKRPVKKIIAAHIDLEKKKGLYSLAKLKDFALKVEQQKIALIELIIKLKKRGKKIAGLSAPAKGNTLLNYCNLDRSFIDFLTEKTQIKIGRYAPGTHIPVYSDRELLERKPDYALILAWNFADELMKNLSDFKKNGGKFIIPIPRPKII